jgi:hypothetical protein
MKKTQRKPRQPQPQQRQQHTLKKSTKSLPIIHIVTSLNDIHVKQIEHSIKNVFKTYFTIKINSFNSIDKIRKPTIIISKNTDPIISALVANATHKLYVEHDYKEFFANDLMRFIKAEINMRETEIIDDITENKHKVIADIAKSVKTEYNYEKYASVYEKRKALFVSQYNYVAITPKDLLDECRKIYKMTYSASDENIGNSETTGIKYATPAKVYHIMGITGAGKTTLGKKILADFSDVVVLDTDDILDANSLKLSTKYNFEKAKDIVNFETELASENKRDLAKFLETHRDKKIIIVGYIHSGMSEIYDVVTKGFIIK